MIFEIPITHNPIPYQNYIRHAGRRRYKMKKLLEYQEMIKAVSATQMRMQGLDIIEGEFSMTINLICKDKRRGDGVNMYKSIEDALEGVAYTNDKNNINGCWQISHNKEAPTINVFIINHETDK